MIRRPSSLLCRGAGRSVHVPAGTLARDSTTLIVAEVNAQIHGVSATATPKPAQPAWSSGSWPAPLSDPKARTLGVALCDLLGPMRDGIDIYGQRRFTSDSVVELGEQLAGWVDQEIGKVKMKVGRHPKADLERATSARAVVGGRVLRRRQRCLHGIPGYGACLALRRARGHVVRGARLLAEDPCGEDGAQSRGPRSSSFRRDA